MNPHRVHEGRLNFKAGKNYSKLFFLTGLGESTNLFEDSANTPAPALDANSLGGDSSGAQESLLLNEYRRIGSTQQYRLGSSCQAVPPTKRPSGKC